MMAEFLPLCDVLFNVISLAGYFCDVVFDLVMCYALLEQGYTRTFAAAITIIVTSLLITQVLSLRWYLDVWSSNPERRKDRPPWAPIILHCLQLGVLWRYARLFVPVDLRHVKHQVRDLCMLRLVHAFCEAAPMLLLQLNVLFKEKVAPEQVEGEPVRDEMTAESGLRSVCVISGWLSLFSVCWALASFNKNVRLHNVHRLVLTWLGVIFQFVWRLGTVSARVCALTVYALVYEYWVFLVIGLHWVSMFLWLISPKSVFHGERMSRARKAWLSALVAGVHVLAYVNLHEREHRRRMVTFYGVMLVENCVLMGAWAGARSGSHDARTVLLGALASFAAGLAFMLLYYRYFHVRRLGYLLGENQQNTYSTNTSSNNKNGKQLGQPDNTAIPGVFNCRFTNPVNGANARKKKKPTTFVPPPAAPATSAAPAAPAAPNAAFWRRPLPSTHNHHGGSSENEGSSVGSRVNIQQKLQEKKQKQLAELRVIEEEIKQGKLTKTTPVAVEEIYSSLQRQPIPRSKIHAEPSWPTLDVTHPYQNYPLTSNYPTYTEIKTYPYNENAIYEKPVRSYDLGDDNRMGSYGEGNFESSVFDGSGGRIYGQGSDGREGRKMQRCRTPEILLAAHYLEGYNRQCCNRTPAYNIRKKEDGASSGSESAHDTPRAPSDIDSQISLPRSYTLPREFRYWRRRSRLRDPHLPSNNSSDGDVDSADDKDSSRRSNCSGTSQPLHERRHDQATPDRRRRPHRKHAKPETKL